ncbi:alpha/beta fold hydrolase [Saccharothrix sp. S26]|uniref:thioesterase II family protein n=1 Tax=Saccharothrix sp. S26 TaxID=2907215 RepID=UPI001F238B57|nr:thioesterase domain-containing protein [Saccharothrix sp. S26]MCE6996337.1 alpha/beta fold hydrolase [Saccharothrix sp. S26]
MTTTAPPAALTLLCFPHAGGNASLFAGWHQVLGVRVVPVELPGRDGDGAATDLAALVDSLADRVREDVRGDYAVYGHSMGALVGAEVVRRLVATGAPAPRALCLGAYPPPHHEHPLVGRLPTDDELGRLIVELTGLPEEVLDHPTWVAGATRLLSGDLALLRGHRFRVGEPLPGPVHVFAGEGDGLAPPEGMAAWAELTESEPVLHVLGGGHFFVRTQRAAFLRRLRAVLVSVTTGAAVG